MTFPTIHLNGSSASELLETACDALGVLVRGARRALRRDRVRGRRSRRCAMTFPTIHLNGSSSSELLETACDALGVLGAAIEAVNATSPHGRDYPQGDSADAAREHANRIAKLWSVFAELEQLAEHIADAQDARDAQ